MIDRPNGKRPGTLSDAGPLMNTETDLKVAQLSANGEAAVRYARIGRRVLPLPPRKKAPPPTGWNDRRPPMTVDEVRAHWLANPEDNIGWGMGDGLICIDIDGDAGWSSLEALEVQQGWKNVLTRSATLTQQTPGKFVNGVHAGGGYHLVFSVPDSKLFGNTVAIAAGIDIRSDGGYIVVAPSVHPAGGSYCWIRKDAATLSLPDACAIWFGRDAHKARQVSPRGTMSSGAVYPATLKACCAFLGGVPKGRRNDTLSAIAFKAGVLGWEGAEEALYAAIADRWDQNALPKHLDTIRSQIAAGRLRADGAAEGAQLERGDHTELSAMLLSALGRPVSTEGALWRYDAERGYYQQLETPEQSRIVQGFAGSWIRRGKKTSQLAVNAATVAGTIELAKHSASQANFFAAAPDGLAFANCFVALTTKGLELRDHSEANRARAGFDFDFDDARPERAIDCLQQAFEGEPDAADRIRLLQEFGGACLFGIAPRYQLALVLLSEAGETAKSTTIALLAGAMPKGTSSAIPPQLFGDQYRRAMLAGIRLNAVNELPTTEISDSESFKAIITGDPIDARHIHEAPFTLRPIAGHLFATNKLPSTGDISSAFFRRFCVLRYPHVVSKEKRISGLAEQIVAAERPALVAWFAIGAAALVARGDYLLPPSSVEEIDAWRTHADSVSSFVADTCEREPGIWIGAAEAYQDYDTYCGVSGFRAANKNTFSARLVALGVRKRQLAKGTEYELRRLGRGRSPDPAFGWRPPVVN